MSDSSQQTQPLQDTLLTVNLMRLSGPEPYLSAMNITVTANGTIITGVAIPPRDWLDLYEQSFGPETDPEVIASLKDTMLKALSHKEAEVSRAMEAKEIGPLPQILHLKDAAILTGPRERLDVGLTRILVSHISAWSPGSIDKG